MSHRKVRIFLASPSDVRQERERFSEVVETLNFQVAEPADLTLELLRWEAFARPGMGRPQGLINSMVGSYDVFVGIMWQRFGTPTGAAGSGTEEEFRIAVERWKRTGAPEILLYFRNDPIPPPRTAEAARQLLAMAEFRENVEANGALTWDYEGVDQLAAEATRHFEGLLRDTFVPDGSRLASRLLASLNDAASVCRRRNVPFQTSDLLDALLVNEDGEMSVAFDKVEPGLSRKLHEMLEEARRGRPAGKDGGFREVDWSKHGHVGEARELADAMDSNTVLERHLGMAFLSRSSGTRDSLLARLGEEKLLSVMEALTSIVDDPVTRPSTADPFGGFR